MNVGSSNPAEPSTANRLGPGASGLVGSSATGSVPPRMSDAARTSPRTRRSVAPNVEPAEPTRQRVDGGRVELSFEGLARVAHPSVGERDDSSRLDERAHSPKPPGTSTDAAIERSRPGIGPPSDSHASCSRSSASMTRFMPPSMSAPMAASRVNTGSRSAREIERPDQRTQPVVHRPARERAPPSARTARRTPRSGCASRRPRSARARAGRRRRGCCGGRRTAPVDRRARRRVAAPSIFA